MIKIILITAAIILLSSCEKKEEQPAYEKMTIEIDPPLFLQKDTAGQKLRQHHIDKELEYYMKRHTVDDDGYDMVANYANKGDKLLGEYVPKGKTNILGMLSLKGIQRRGIGISIDSCHHVFYGSWKNDTLTTGIRVDSAGIYAGQFNRDMLANGHGCQRTFDGSFYEGHWTDNRKEGFGFLVSTKIIQTGTWKNNRFFGEHMKHTSDRIYGIDISRYQHEKGRRRFGINWNDLRVTSLGRRIKGNISGEVDYPVRFVYIKSTQGTTIRNRYLLTDYMAARKKNIPVGTYHFFSTVRKGQEQAAYYVNHTLFKNGDLPPVLDIEPTNRQIAKMGGTAALLREVRSWISYVEHRLHIKPILYVNQRFITEHLSQAPDLMENYTIWIARYGEYKPGIHLALWQVSSDSKVKGIQTDVDVNVFNGYEPQWEEFLREETIKK